MMLPPLSLVRVKPLLMVEAPLRFVLVPLQMLLVRHVLLLVLVRLLILAVIAGLQHLPLKGRKSGGGDGVISVHGARRSIIRVYRGRQCDNCSTWHIGCFSCGRR